MNEVADQFMMMRQIINCHPRYMHFYHFNLQKKNNPNCNTLLDHYNHSSKMWSEIAVVI